MTVPRLPTHGDTVCLMLTASGRSVRTITKPTPGKPIDRPSWPFCCPAGLSGPCASWPANTAEGWARDVAAQIAQEVLTFADQDLSPAVRDVVEWGG
jgi:hypothetical protein